MLQDAHARGQTDDAAPATIGDHASQSTKLKHVLSVQFEGCLMLMYGNQSSKGKLLRLISKYHF